MSLIALSFVIAGALLHALWNVLAKKASGGLPFVWLFGIVSLIVSLPFGVFALYVNSQQLTAWVWIAIILSGVVHVAYSLVLQKGYRESEFSIVYPLARGIGPLFAVLGAMIVLGETPNRLGWVGIFSVLIGILLISDVIRILSMRSRKAQAGILWGAITGLSIAAYTVVDGWAVKTLGVAPVLYYFLCLMLRTIILTPRALRNTQEIGYQWRENRGYIIAVGIFSPLAYTLILFAMTMAPLSYVAPIRELSMFFGVFFGAKLLRESLTPSHIAGVVFIITGIAMLAFTK